MSVLVNHDYPQVHALQVLTQDGEPIEGAHITVYQASIYYSQSFSGWVTQQNVLFGEEWDGSGILFGYPDDFFPVFQMSWVGETYTDENGEWIDDIYLDEAQTWLIKIDFSPDYSPRSIEVTT